MPFILETCGAFGKPALQLCKKLRKIWMTKCCSGNDSWNYSSLRQFNKQHQSIDPLLVSISILFQTHNGQMILERAPLSPKLLDSEIARSQARSNTHKEWAAEKLHDLEKGDAATLRRFSLSVKVAPAFTSTQVQRKVLTIKDQPTQPHGLTAPPSKSQPSSIPTFPRPLSEPTAHSKVTIAYPTKDPTSTCISRLPTAGAAVTMTKGHLHNKSDKISVRDEPRAVEKKQASTAEYKVPVPATHTHSEDTAANTGILPPYSVVCEDAPSLDPPTKSETTQSYPQTNSFTSDTSHLDNLDNWKWLPPNSNHNRPQWAKSDLPTNYLNCTVTSKQQPCDSPTKATTNLQDYGLPGITKQVLFSSLIQEETQRDIPSTAPDIHHTQPSTADHPIRTDHRSCPNRIYTHRKDRSDPDLRNTGGLEMDFEPNTNDRDMDHELPPSLTTMILDS